MNDLINQQRERIAELERHNAELIEQVNSLNAAHGIYMDEQFEVRKELKQRAETAEQRVKELESKLEAVTQEARIQACELDTQKGIVQSVQDKFNLRVYDFNGSTALDMALKKFAIEKQIEALENFITAYCESAMKFPVPEFNREANEAMRRALINALETASTQRIKQLRAKLGGE